MRYNTALYIRRRDTAELWQLFLGGRNKAQPSALYDSYLTYFKELHADYEWVVLEKRKLGNQNRWAYFRIGDSRQVDVMPNSEEPEWGKPRYYEEAKLVECLSLWHMDRVDKLFLGSTTNRLCPECAGKEADWRIGKERDYE